MYDENSEHLEPEFTEHVLRTTVVLRSTTRTGYSRNPTFDGGTRHGG